MNDSNSLVSAIKRLKQRKVSVIYNGTVVGNGIISDSGLLKVKLDTTVVKLLRDNIINFTMREI